MPSHEPEDFQEIQIKAKFFSAYPLTIKGVGCYIGKAVDEMTHTPSAQAANPQLDVV
jgi:hypothetical protein